MKKVKEGRGITLIALVITIIVLLILAGISISMLSGDNSILSRAAEAKEKTIGAQNEEQTKLAQGSAALNLKGTVTSEGIKIPAGFAVSEKEEENSVEDGLVMVDSNGNEYVWIEVPKTVTVSATSDTEIYSALREYCSTDVNNDTFISSTETNNYKTTTRGWSDEYFEGCGLSASEYNELKSKMLNSIKSNGGFWIGKYEAGILNPRDNRNNSIEEIIPQSKKDLYPINYVTCSQAQTIASRLTREGEYTSSLMFGIQWDLVLKYLNNNGMGKDLLTDNSENWGNYNLEYNLGQKTVHGYKGIYANNVLTWSKIEKGYVHNGTDYIALSTGATERNKKQNIYDLAGNMYEWTLEHSTYFSESENMNYPCASRGGSLNATNSSCAASYRSGYSTSYSKYFVGFRVSLY